MARLNRLLLPTILVFLVSQPQAEPGRIKTHVLDVPRLAADGALPAKAQPGSYIFLDEAAGDLVLFFPSDLSEENFWLPSDKEWVTETVRLAIGVRPTLETEVTANAGLSYEYRLGNETGATKPIGTWILGLPGGDEDIRATNVPRVGTLTHGAYPMSGWRTSSA